MNRKEVIEKYKAGFSVGNGYETVEWLLDEKETTSDRLHFQAYDANLMPLPIFSKWDTKYKRLQINTMRKYLHDWNGSVWLDDEKIK